MKGANTRQNGKTYKKGARLSDDATLWDLEEQFWTQGADKADKITPTTAASIGPNPAGILQGDAIFLQANVALRWRSVVMSDRFISQ